MFVIYVRRDRALRIPYKVFALFRDILIISNYALNQGIQSLYQAYGASFFFSFFSFFFKIKYSRTFIRLKCLVGYLRYSRPLIINNAQLAIER